MGILDFVIKPLSEIFNVISFGLLGKDKFENIINDSIGMALSFTKVGTPLQLFENISNVKILPDKIGKGRMLGKIVDELGLGSSFIGKGVHSVEDVLPINLFQDKLKEVVSSQKAKWMEEMKGMTFQSQAELNKEIERRVQEEKRQLEIKMINETTVELSKGDSSFMVVDTTILTDDAKNAYKGYLDKVKDKDKKYYEERLEYEKQKQKTQYDTDREKFVNDFITGNKKVEASKMAWFNYMKGYYKV